MIAVTAYDALTVVALVLIWGGLAGAVLLGAYLIATDARRPESVRQYERHQAALRGAYERVQQSCPARDRTPGSGDTSRQVFSPAAPRN